MGPSTVRKKRSPTSQHDQLSYLWKIRTGANRSTALGDARSLFISFYNIHVKSILHSFDRLIIVLRYVLHHGETTLPFPLHVVAVVSTSGTGPDHCSNDNCLYGQSEFNSRICIPSSDSDWPIPMPYGQLIYDFHRFAKLVSDISGLDMHFRVW